MIKIKCRSLFDLWLDFIDPLCEVTSLFSFSSYLLAPIGVFIWLEVYMAVDYFKWGSELFIKTDCVSDLLYISISSCYLTDFTKKTTKQWHILKFLAQK